MSDLSSEQVEPWVFAEMPHRTPDGQGYGDLSGEQGTIFVNDKVGFDPKELTNWEWIQIVARKAGGGAYLDHNGMLTEAAHEHNAQIIGRQRRVGEKIPSLISAIVITRVSEEVFMDTLLHYDPVKNRTQL